MYQQLSQQCHSGAMFFFRLEEQFLINRKNNMKKCVIMCVLVKLYFAADLRRFPVYTIIIISMRQGTPSLAHCPYGGCAAIYIVPRLCCHIYAIAIIGDQQTPILQILYMYLNGLCKHCNFEMFSTTLLPVTTSFTCTASCTFHAHL